MKEEWTAVKGYEGHYEVSSAGRVRSLKRKFEVLSKNGKKYIQTVPARIMKTTPVFGYPALSLRKNRKHQTERVHKLVVEAFIPEDPERKFVNHIDGDRGNNNLENLERCTHLENMRHKIDVLGKGVRDSGSCSKLSVSEVLAIRLVDYTKITKRSVGKIYGVHETTIHNILTRRIWKSV